MIAFTLLSAMMIFSNGMATITDTTNRTHKEINNHVVLKRSFAPFPFGPYHEDHISRYTSNKLRSFGPQPNIISLIPIEVANAIAAAKQASANVLIAQQQVQAAKENILLQQRIAIEKESQAEILRRKTESAAAIQRSEAAAAAQGVLLAQQRLDQAKSSVAHQQHIASTKEALAAIAFHRIAQEAAADIHKSEHEASRLGIIQQTDSAAAAHHLSVVKDSAVSSLTGSHVSPHTNVPQHYGLTNTWPNVGTASTELYSHTHPVLLSLFMPKSSVGHVPTSPWIL